jgi:integrase
MRGDGRVFQRGSWLWVSYFVRGQEIREAARDKNGKNTTDRVTAEKYLRARLKEVHADEIGAATFITPAARKVKIDELADALEADFTLRGKLSAQNRSHLNRVKKDFGNYAALSLTAEKIDAYIEQRLAENDRPATINRTTQMLGQCYKLAIIRRHLVRAPHIRHLSEAGNARQGFLSPADFAKLRDALPADLRDFCEFGYITGMRLGEVKALRWRDLEGESLTLRGEDSKNGEARIVPLVGELAAIISRRPAARPVKENGAVRMAETIFHRDGAPVGEFRKAWQTAAIAAGLGRMICRACGREGVEKSCPDCKRQCKYHGEIFHNFRRAAARNLSQAGVPQAVAMKITGHKTASMYQRYNIVVTDDLRKALERTEQYRAEQKIVAIR